MEPRNDVHALVVGVDFYLPGEVAGAIYPPLRGCVADAREVALYLKAELGVPEGNVRLLTATRGGGGSPAEPPGQRPDYDTLTAALADLVAVARPGDQVLFYFAGHGGRVPTLVPEVKGETGLDECLVPYDASTGTRLLRDVEIAAMVADMAERGLHVTLALDCCHAGGALKAPPEQAAVRGVPFVNDPPRVAGSAIASPEILAAAWRAAGGFCPRGVVLLAACRPGEPALEALVAGRLRGIFTWALLDGLRRLGTGLAYRRLHERVLGGVQTLFEIQTPMLEGDAERRVLGGEPRKPLSAVPVLAVENDGVILAVGAPQGVGTGAWLAVHPLGAEDLSRTGERVALVEVTEAGASRSRARLATVLRPDVPVEQGALAALVSSGDLRVRRVAFLDGADRPPLAAVAARLAGPEPSGFVALAPAGATPDFFLAPAPGGGVEVRDGVGETLAALPGGPDAVVTALEHLARFRNVQALDNPDTGSDLHETLVVSLDWLPGPWRPREPLRPQPFQAQPPCVRPGDWLCLTLENRSVRELNVAVLDLQADWSIRQAYPTGAFEPLDADACRRIPFEVRWPFRQPRGRDRLKVFATTGAVDFRWLELPALGEPPLRQLRSPFPSPLNALLAALTGLPLHARALDPERHPQHEWIVRDLTMEVDAGGR